MVEQVSLVDDQDGAAAALGVLAGEDVPGLDGEGGGAVDGPAAEGGDDAGEDAAGAGGRVADVDDCVPGGVEAGDGGPDRGGLAGADLAGDHADGPSCDGPGDAGGGLGAVGVPVEPARGQVAAERHPAEAEPVDDGVDHERASFRDGLPLTGASRCRACSRSRARAAALPRAPDMKIQAPLTAQAGSVLSSQPSRPAASAAASQRPTWPRSCGRRDAASDSSPRTA